MKNPNQKKIRLSTNMGNVTIASFCSPEEINALILGDSFDEGEAYYPIVSKKETLLKAAALPDSNVTLAFTDQGIIVAIGILEYTGADERWTRVGENMMMEVSVVEVSRPFRSTGIAKDLMALMADHPLKEKKIFYMVGYSWTWDIEGGDITLETYREIMIKLFGRLGFVIFQTNEPNILLRPENIFMVRIGKSVPSEVVTKLKKVAFNLDI